MIQLVLPSQKYQQSFIQAVKEIKQQTDLTSPAMKQFYDYDITKLENDFDNYIVKPLIDTMNGMNLPDGFVPATEFWIIKDEKFVGRICLRHALTPFMQKYVGHIGYMVIPSFQRQNIAKQALTLVLDEAHKTGLSQVLIIAEKDNTISNHILSQALKKYGGFQDTPQYKNDKIFLCYWINTVK